MSSPFPGMDPYLESQGYWHDFHPTFLTACRRALTAVLPRHYAAFVEEQISLVDLSDQSQVYKPDVGVTLGKTRPTQPVGRGIVATLEPIDLPIALEDLDQVRDRWIEIKRLPDRSLVTVIEILSPTNKMGSGRIEYIEKRKEWLRQPTHFVEIDLLVRGQRTPMGGRLPRETLSSLSHGPLAALSAKFTAGRSEMSCQSFRFLFRLPILTLLWT